ncbi:hypothetical protein [Nocardia sp. NPDC051832]|uniref:hypothetical protein n=1 Tax=Nocardia sp. NPDC051832 TaxID=3155673 RepID=UPI00341A79DC
MDWVLDGTHPAEPGLGLDLAVREVVSEDFERSAVDEELYLALHEHDFAGPAWDEFAETLIRHGASVLTGWSRSGWIFKALRDHGVRLTPPATQLERQRLGSEGRFRQELVRASVASALIKVQRELRAGSGWNPDRGRSLSSYFVGACVLALGNEFRKWRRRDHFRYPRDGDLDPFELADCGYGEFCLLAPFPDPEATAITNAMLREELSGLTELERAIVWAKVNGYTAAEIAELYPDITRKAIEYRWGRLKQEHQWVDRLSTTRRLS